jgi:hypothetical protein
LVELSKVKYGDLKDKLCDPGLLNDANPFAGSCDTVKVIYGRPGVLKGARRAFSSSNDLGVM